MFLQLFIKIKLTFNFRMNSQKKTRTRKRPNDSPQQKAVQENTQISHSESFSQPLIKSPRLQRKSKSIAKENSNLNFFFCLTQIIISFSSRVLFGRSL